MISQLDEEAVEQIVRSQKLSAHCQRLDVAQRPRTTHRTVFLSRYFLFLFVAFLRSLRLFTSSLTKTPCQLHCRHHNRQQLPRHRASDKVVNFDRNSVRLRPVHCHGIRWPTSRCLVRLLEQPATRPLKRSVSSFVYAARHCPACLPADQKPLEQARKQGEMGQALQRRLVNIAREFLREAPVSAWGPRAKPITT